MTHDRTGGHLMNASQTSVRNIEIRTKTLPPGPGEPETLRRWYVDLELADGAVFTYRQVLRDQDDAERIRTSMRRRLARGHRPDLDRHWMPTPLRRVGVVRATPRFHTAYSAGQGLRVRSRTDGDSTREKFVVQYVGQSLVYEDPGIYTNREDAEQAMAQAQAQIDAGCRDVLLGTWDQNWSERINGPDFAVLPAVQCTTGQFLYNLVLWNADRTLGVRRLDVGAEVQFSAVPGTYRGRRQWQILDLAVAMPRPRRAY
jgi:hypothetical protein